MGISPSKGYSPHMPGTCLALLRCESSENPHVHATLIVNPYASSVTEDRVRAVERELGGAYELATVLTEQRGHAIELAREAEGDAIFAFGGDGVFNEVLNGADGRRLLGF